MSHLVNLGKNNLLSNKMKILQQRRLKMCKNCEAYILVTFYQI